MLWIRWIFLLPFFILFWLVLSAFTRISSGYRRFFLTLSLAAALMVLGTAFWGRWTHSFELSFILNSLSAALGIAVLRQRKDPRPKSQWKIQWSWGLLAVLLFIVSTTIMVSSIALRFDFHDQLRTQGHLPLVESMLRGNFPPHMMVFPQIPLKYHYGGDLFSAILAWVMGISAHRAIDIAMIYAGLNEKEQAIVWITKAYEERSARMQFLKVDPVFSSLRPDPYFQDLLRGMGFPETKNQK